MTPRTLKDLVPILEELNREIKFARMRKDDFIERNNIHKTLTELRSLDIESMVIESISLDTTGNVLANTLRNTLAEIIARVEDIRLVNPTADYGETPERAFDKYESEVFEQAANRFFQKYLLYRDAMILDEKVKGFEERRLKEMEANGTETTQPQISPLSMVKIPPGTALNKIRQEYLKAKKRFLSMLQHSIDFEENLHESCRPKLRDVVDVCKRITNVISKYYPPCDIVLPKMPTEIEAERESVKNDKEKTAKKPSGKKSSVAPTPWEGDVFPMALTSELYEISKDFFHVESEAAFHSALNLHYKYDPITAKKGHHNRVAYMVQQLFNLLPSHQNREWRDTFLDYVGVERSYYDSKSSHATSDDASKRSQRYVEELDTVLKNHRKRA